MSEKKGRTTITGDHNIVGSKNAIITMNVPMLSGLTEKEKTLTDIHGIPHLPIVNVSESQASWLKEVWKLLLETGSLPNYKRVRSNTITQTGVKFLPDQIDRRLLNEKSVEITLLGVLHIQKDSKVLDDLDRVITVIKNQILADLDHESFDLMQIADGLQLDRQYVKTIFTLGSYYGGFWNSASSMGNGSPFGYENFAIKDRNFEFYLNFDSIRKTIDDYYIEEAKRNKESPSWVYPTPKSLFGQHAEPVIDRGDYFVNLTRLDELRRIKSNSFDLSKLIRLCEELNFNFSKENYLSVAMLTRTILDHVPPIFEKTTFSKVVAEYGARSFKEVMKPLEESSRKITNGILHSTIQVKEILPNRTQVNFSQSMDVLLGEIVRRLG